MIIARRILIRVNFSNAIWARSIWPLLSAFRNRVCICIATGIDIDIDYAHICRVGGGVRILGPELLESVLRFRSWLDLRRQDVIYLTTNNLRLLQP